MSETKAGRASWASLLAVGLAFALLIGLGTWQMQRKAWKESVLAAIDARAKWPPVTTFDLKALGCAPDRGLLDVCDFRPIVIRGQLVDGVEAHIFISIPRQPIGLEGQGYWVFQKFELAEPTTDVSHVWINRGFVPEAKKAAVSRSGQPASASVEIAGIIRRAEPRATFSGRNDNNRNVYFVRDPREFDACSKATKDCTDRTPTSYYIDMISPVPAGNLPFPMVGKIAIPNRHLEYALTWYALAATLLVVGFFRLRPDRAA